MVTSESKPTSFHEKKLFLQEEEETFQWTKQWYPVAVIKYIDHSHPHQIQLLGKDLVLWRDGQNKWRCFDDVCPHRLVPLSEGRIESDGTLLCAYHAWRFDGEGNCVRIPQSENAVVETKNCDNSKACAVSYPVKELQGLIWVWGESGEQGKTESELRKPRLIPELENPSERVIKLYWYQRDFPFGWDYYLENVMAPAHAPVSHHNLIGNRYTDAKYYDMIPLRKVSTQEGFSFEITSTSEEIIQSKNDFQPPCLQRIESSYQDGGKLILILYAIPTRPGWCRQIGCQILVKNNQGKRPPGLSFFGAPIPDWLGHVLSSLFLHQDLVFLHHQEKIINKKNEGKWIEKVYTPNPQDKMIITFRNWLRKRAGGGVAWDKNCNLEIPPVERDKAKLFDVYSTHTKDCEVCKNALKNINRLTVFSFVSSIICLFLALFIDSRNVAINGLKENFSFMPPLGFWLLIGGAIALALIGYYLKKFSRLFYVYEFEHHRND